MAHLRLIFGSDAKPEAHGRARRESTSRAPTKSGNAVYHAFLPPVRDPGGPVSDENLYAANETLDNGDTPDNVILLPQSTQPEIDSDDLEADDSLYFYVDNEAPDEPDNVIPWRWSTRPIIDSDDPEHADQIRDDPATLAGDIIFAMCLVRRSRGEPLGELEHLQVEDIARICRPRATRMPSRPAWTCYAPDVGYRSQSIVLRLLSPGRRECRRVARGRYGDPRRSPGR